jgi:hypothetical protein
MDEDARNRFWSKVEKSESCWNWSGFRYLNGYGGFSLGYSRRMAHRVSWELVNERELPTNLVVDHLCRNVRCVNPEHLEPVTQRENLRRGSSPFAQRVALVESGVCHRGHDLTKPDAWWTSPSGSERKCAACMREVRRQRYLREKIANNIPDRNLGRICDVDGCTEPYAAKGKCRRHYDRWRKSGRPLAA